MARKKVNIKGRVFLVGDVHGKFFDLSCILHNKRITNATIVVLGDFGLGFGGNEAKELRKLNKWLQLAKSKLYVIRGNHDDPSYWEESASLQLNKKYKRIYLVSDGTIFNIHDNYFLCVGGGISVDRWRRTEGVSYWSDEAVNIDKIVPVEDEYLPIYGILSHSFIKPPVLPDLKFDTLGMRDPTLKYAVEKEQEMFHFLVKNVHPKRVFCGHYHVNSLFAVPKHESTEVRALDVLDVMELEL